MVTQIPVSASLTQQNFYLNSISNASDSTVSAPSAGQVLSYTGSSWTNSTLSLPTATSFVRGFQNDNTTRTLTNSTQIGSYYMFDVFAGASYSVFANSADWTITNARVATYNGSSSQTFRVQFGYTGITTNGNSIIVVVNGTILYSSYSGSIANQQSWFQSQPITFTPGTTLSIGCTASFQTIQNISLDTFQQSGFINQPVQYVNPPTIQTKYFQCFANNITLQSLAVFSQGGKIDLSNLTAINSNDATSFTKSQYGITINTAGTY